MAWAACPTFCNALSVECSHHWASFGACETCSSLHPQPPFPLACQPAKWITVLACGPLCADSDLVMIVAASCVMTASCCHALLATNPLGVKWGLKASVAMCHLPLDSDHFSISTNNLLLVGTSQQLIVNRLL